MCLLGRLQSRCLLALRSSHFDDELVSWGGLPVLPKLLYRLNRNRSWMHDRDELERCYARRPQNEVEACPQGGRLDSRVRSRRHGECLSEAAEP